MQYILLSLKLQKHTGIVYFNLIKRQSLAKFNQVPLKHSLKRGKKTFLSKLSANKIDQGNLKINYETKIRNSDYLRDQIKLQDFINSEFQNFKRPEMQQNSQFSKEQHEKDQLETQGNCLVCQGLYNKNTSTLQICHACSKMKYGDASFCNKCFEVYHKQKDPLFNHMNQKVSDSELNKKLQAVQHGANFDQKDKKHVRQKQQRQKNEKIMKMSQKSEKLPLLTENQMQKALLLQQNALKLLQSTGSLKNTDLFYKAKHSETKSKMQYQAQIKNQIQFHNIISKTISKQLNLFQDDVFAEVQYLNKSKMESEYENKSEIWIPKEMHLKRTQNKKNEF